MESDLDLINSLHKYLQPITYTKITQIKRLWVILLSPYFTSLYHNLPKTSSGEAGANITMEATNFQNRHDVLGAGTHTSPTNSHTSRQTNDITNNTVNPGPTLREEKVSHDFARGPGNYSTSPAHDSSQQERANIIRATEIGDPNGRIPTAQDTHNQLNDARDDLIATQRNNPSAAASHASQGVPRTNKGNTDTGVPTLQSGHQNSNYTPGYDGAADAVRHNSHIAEDHRPSVLAHEPVDPLTKVPTDRGDTTQQHSSNKGPGMIPGVSIGEKAKAPFAKIHVSNRQIICVHAVITQLTYPQGAGEMLRGNLAAVADSFTGDKKRQAENEGIARRGQEELTHGKFDKAQTSSVEY